MNRKNFINHFSQNYKNEYSNHSHGLHFDIDLSTIDNNGSLCLLYVNSKFDDIFNSMGLSPFKIDKSLVRFEFDYDYAEEEADNDICRYSTYINLNILYDAVILKQQLYGHQCFVYRIEDTENKGLYSGVGFKIMCDSATGIQPNPADDPCFMSIFKQFDNYVTEDYKKKWQFAFNDFEQMKNWIGDKNSLDALIKHGYHIKEIAVSEHCLIVGREQVIYQQHGVDSVKKLELSTIAELFHSQLSQNLQTKKKPSVR